MMAALMAATVSGRITANAYKLNRQPTVNHKETTMDMHDNHSGNTDSSGTFCSGSGMVMFMDGFRSGLQGGQPCINLYLTGWTLDNRTKYIAAMTGVFFLAIFVEWISKARQGFIEWARKDARRRRVGGRRSNARAARAILVSIHGIQASVGYILMLATMTFATELLVMTILGLSVGYAWFFLPALEDEDLVSDNSRVNANPCCNFTEEESKDISKGEDDDSLTIEDGLSLSSDLRESLLP